MQATSPVSKLPCAGFGRGVHISVQEPLQAVGAELLTFIFKRHEVRKRGLRRIPPLQ